MAHSPCTDDSVVTGPYQAARGAGKCSLQLAVLLQNWNFVTRQEVRKDSGGAIPHCGMDLGLHQNTFSFSPTFCQQCRYVLTFSLSTVRLLTQSRISMPLLLAPRGHCSITYGASPVLPLPSFFLDALLIVARNQTLLLWVSNLLIGPKCCTRWKWAHIIDWWDIRKPSVLAHVSLRSQW